MLFYVLLFMPHTKRIGMRPTWLLLIIREVVLGRFSIKVAGTIFFSLFVENYEKNSIFKNMFLIIM